jgi:hypothetical protein
VTTDARSQFEVVLANGCRIDRLPLGLAAGRWWFMVVFSGTTPDWFSGDPSAWSIADAIASVVRLEGPYGAFTALSGAGGKGDLVHAYFEVQPIPWLRLTYLDEGQPTAIETLDLSSAPLR